MSEERRSGTMDEAKFATQKSVTYFLLVIFAAVTATVLYQNDQSERSMVLQTVINLTLLAVGYWVGASKAAADSTATMGKLAEQAGPSVEKAVAAARAPALEAAPPLAATPEATDATPVPVKIVEGAGTAGGEPLNVKEEQK